MKIRLIGLRNNLGIGQHYGYFADALRRAWPGTVDEINSQDQEALYKAAASSEPEDINISFVCLPLEDHFQGHNIQWVVFESTLIPGIVLDTLQRSQWIWVPSHWGYSTLLANGLSRDRIDIVPEGVDPNRFQPSDIEPGQPFRFLSLGKAERRKSIGETMQAFAQAFGRDPTVQLTVKTDHFYNAEAKRAELEHYAAQLNSNIQIQWGSWTTDHIRDLYHDCHVFVLPSKGEGWGLPLIEAVASGMPVITTTYSAPRDYLSLCTGSLIPVEYDLAPVDCEEYRLFYQLQGQPMGQWAQPRVTSIAAGMQLARSNYRDLRTHARAASQAVRAQFNWAACADRALKTLRRRGLLPS